MKNSFYLLVDSDSFNKCQRLLIKANGVSEIPSEDELNEIIERAKNTKKFVKKYFGGDCKKASNFLNN